jgi:uncharacterized phage protein (TIGR01671 family)
MREILFRGKAKNGDWVYGNFAKVERNDDSGLYDYHIIQMPKDGYTAYIDPETIGQYTGLCDENGTKIFEGDIVETIRNNFIHPEAAKVGRVMWCEAYSGYAVVYAERANSFLANENERSEVIGNIYDNPELLEVEE